eukprot:FR739044.1.p1 GENE.FR739044.1~~FR739044.1.p1  ORF type:complete len:140 (+),score=18.60 FR739044.1:78-497(+)
MATGIDVPDEVVATFSDFKLKRTSYRVLQFKIEGTAIVAATHLEKGGEDWFDEFLGQLDTTQPRFIFIDYDYETTDGRPADKLVFVSWIPDDCKIKDKMKYAGTKESMKTACVGVSLNLNATDLDEITADILNKECNRI